jgi:C1A family cysteine protease
MYNKEYETLDEYNYRLGIFNHNIELIQNHNSQHLDWTMDTNEWTDRTWEEFSSTRLGYNYNNQIPPTYIIDASTDLPDAIDWRDHGVVTPVKNQGQCGSCWAFSAVETIESAVAIHTGSLTVLSEQELVDCDHNGDLGCSGGLMTQAFGWVVQNGLCTEKSYPYQAKNGQCRQSSCSPVDFIKGYANVPSNNQLALKQAVAKQPIAVAIEADQQGFQFYSSGVFTGSCGTNLDHGVSLVGYGSENGVDYWLVRNSWGDSWGDGGYIKLLRTDDTGPGQCGIAMMASYPLV